MNLQLCEPVELQLQDGIGLLVGEVEALDELLMGIAAALAGPDHDDDLVEHIEDGGKGLEDVDAGAQLLQLKLKPPLDRAAAEVQPEPQDLLEVGFDGCADLEIVGGDEAGEVDGVGDLERGVPEEVGHRRRRFHPGIVSALAAKLHHHPDLVGGLVSNIDKLRHLLGNDEPADLLDEGAFVDAVGDGVDDDEALTPFLFKVPVALELDRSAAGFVDVLKLLAVVEDGTTGGEVRTLQLAGQIGERGVWIIEQDDSGVDDLAEVVRRNSGGHTHRDAFASVDEELRELRRQHDGFEVLTVVVGAVVDGALLQLREQLDGDGGELALAVPHGSGGVAIEGAEVALSEDERVSQGEGLDHADEGVVDRGITVGVILGHDLTNHRGRLTESSVRQQTEVVVHRIENAPLNRLQPVTYIGQCPGGDDGESVIEVAVPGRFVERYRADLRHGWALRATRPGVCGAGLKQRGRWESEGGD